MLDQKQLEAYVGRNPKPADFDDFWDQSVAEMKQTDPQLSIIPANFRSPVADCYHMYFTGVHGAKVYAKLLKPKQISGKCPAVLNFHGYHRKSDQWFAYLPYVASGFVVAALDCRGQAGNSQDVGGNAGNSSVGHLLRGVRDTPDKLLFRDIFLDAAQLAGLVMSLPEVDENRVGVYGGSQGGGIALACAALEPRVRKTAVSNPFLSDYQTAWELGATQYAFAELETYFRLEDPCHERQEEFFTKLGYIDVQHLAPRIRGKVLMNSGFKDVVCPAQTHFAAYNRLTCQKCLRPYPDFGHEELPESNDKIYQFFLEE